MAVNTKHQEAFKNHFRRHSVFVSYVKKFMPIVALPLIFLSILITFYQYRVTLVEKKTSDDELFSTTFVTVENIYTEVENLFNIIRVERGIEDFIKTDDITTVSAEDLAIMKKPLNISKTHCALSNYVDAVHIYSYASDYVLSTSHTGYISNFETKPWRGYSSDELCFSVPSEDDLNKFSICYNVIEGSKKCGLIVFDVEFDKGVANSDNGSEKTYKAQLWNKDKQRLYASDALFEKTPYTFPEEDVVETTRIGNITEMVLKKNNIYYHMFIEHKHSLFGRIVFLSIFYILFVIIISFVIAAFLSSYSYRTIKEILMIIESVSSDDSYDRSTDEIMYISENIAEMKLANQRLEHEIVNSFVRLKNMQIQVYQSQLTPHFLFNALNNLNTSLMLKHGMDNPESESIMILADLLTASINTSHYLIPVKQELEYCKKYLEMQSMIYNDNFDVVWDVDEGLDDYLTVQLSLQPLVENTFKHGICNLKNKIRGYIAVSVKRFEDIIEFTVVNNGSSSTDAEIEEINAALKAEQVNKNRIGIFNTNMRIKLVFGKEYGCSIKKENNLVVSKISIPYVTHNDLS